jgi:hypothetical protein
MDTKSILSQLRAERARIDQAIAALQALDGVARSSAGASVAKAAPGARRRRRMSAATRKRLSEMMKKRWAARRKAKG